MDADVYKQLLDRSIIKEAKFKRLVKESDGQEYAHLYLTEAAELDGLMGVNPMAPVTPRRRAESATKRGSKDPSAQVDYL